MPVDKIQDCRFLSDKEQAQRAAREQLKSIMANKSKLLNVRGGRKYLVAAASFHNSKEDFTPNQLSYIDVIYERMMKGSGYESYSSTFKPKKGLRF